MKKYLLILSLINGVIFGQPAQSPVPPNSFSKMELKKNFVEISYNGSSVLKGNFSENEEIVCREVSGSDNEIVNQLFIFTAKSRKPVTLTGIIEGTKESFPCEVDRKINDDDDFVRNSSGLSRSLLNRALYDRKFDFVLSVDYPANVKIEPVESSESKNIFRIKITGTEIPIRFRPRFYQKHRGLKYFEPWNYKVWDKSIAGWCSWFAYFDKIDEEKIHHATDVISEKLKPFGAEYIQIDDGYQKNPIGMPETWLNGNKKFPSGMKNLAQYISGKGLIPGIWTNVSFADKEAAFKYKNYFVPDAESNPAYGRWVGYIMDGSNKATLEKLISPVYSGFKEMGWNYFKLDALRHLRYEGYNSYSEYFKNKNLDRVEVFRDIVKSVRKETKESFLLACWGIRPELIGLVDGCRIGGDGFGWESLAQYNSFNNVIWKNDPDHIELSEREAYRSCSAVSLTGSLFMLTDNPEKYYTPVAEAAIRSIPVLSMRPTQIYDVDPSRSNQLSRVDYEMSGDGARVFDASRATPYDLFLLELNRNFGNWVVLGRMGESRNYIDFSKIGLDKEKEFLVFEFWSKKFIGKFLNGFVPGGIDKKFNCQIFSIREYLKHPQLIATNRHISCGGLEIANLHWDKNELEGKSDLVANDPYSIYIYEPENFSFSEFLCEGVKFIGSSKEGQMREIKIVSEQAKQIDWKIVYK